MPPKTLKRTESLRVGKSKEDKATKKAGLSSTFRFADVAEAMTEETSRLQKAPTKKDAEAPAEGKSRKRANKSVEEIPAPKKKTLISRSASVRVVKAPLEETTKKGVKGGKPTLKRNISVRGRKKPELVTLDSQEEEDEDSVVVVKAVDGKTAKALAMKNKKQNKTVQEEMEEMDVDDDVVEAAGDATQSAADPNNNKKGAKRKVETTLKRTASIKQKKVTVKPISDRGVGILYTFGKGDMGQLGLGESVLKRNYPSLLDDLKDLKFVQVVAGGLHTVALDDSGTVWTFGCNDDKALGRVTQDEEENFVPGKVNLKQRIVQVSAGDSHSAALTEEGDVYAWGTFKDSNGNIGLVPGEGEMCRVDAQLISAVVPTKVQKISSGDHHLVMLTLDGKIYTCGNGEMGQLGREFDFLAKRATRSVTVQNASVKDVMLRPDQVRCRSKFADIWTGSFATYAATATRKPTSDIWVFGLNSQGQLGMEPEGGESVIMMPTKSSGFSSKKWKQIAGGQHHAVALDSEGQVYSLGRGDDGRLGLGDDTADKHKPTLVPGLESQTCVQVSAGLSTAYAITKEGVLYSWGCGVNFQLGNGSSDESLDPIKVEYMVEEKKKLDLEGEVMFISGGGQHVVLTLSKKSQDLMET